MKASEIFRKTLTFVWIRLGINLAISVGVMIWTILWILIAGAIGNAIGVLLAIIAICASVKIVDLIQQYVGYMIKSAHIAVTAEAFQHGSIPDNMVEFGKEQVKKKFAQANVYILLDKLVSGSIRQIHKVVDVTTGWIEKIIPQAAFLTNILKKFTTVSLTYVDECCLCYTFMKPEQSPFQSAADGVVIYFQNWKGLLKSSAKGTGIVLVAELVVGIVVFLITLGIAGLFHTSLGWLIALVAAVCIIYSLRDALLGSYMMIYTMENFHREVQKGEIAVDLYGKLCGMSQKFKELFDKGNAQSPVQQPVCAAVHGDGSPASYAVEPVESHCSGCGAPLDPNTAFCPSCGRKQ